MVVRTIIRKIIVFLSSFVWYNLKEVSRAYSIYKAIFNKATEYSSRIIIVFQYHLFLEYY